METLTKSDRSDIVSMQKYHLLSPSTPNSHALNTKPHRFKQAPMHTVKLSYVFGFGDRLRMRTLTRSTLRAPDDHERCWPCAVRYIAPPFLALAKKNFSIHSSTRTIRSQSKIHKPFFLRSRNSSTFAAWPTGKVASVLL